MADTNAGLLGVVEAGTRKAAARALEDSVLALGDAASALCNVLLALGDAALALRDVLAALGDATPGF